MTVFNERDDVNAWLRALPKPVRDIIKQDFIPRYEVKEKEQKIALFQSRITLEYANYLKWLETHPTCSKEQREHINQCMDLLKRISER
jgi:hypothetical protein